ncbi:GNAT family N-acetyltransferase [Nisaea acidiphila]|uniref:GNAT family N-acetyltransferase n=1 Tax=Nisaea acidiphila TaxID=1862145 RepID=A0A9J7AZB9_9PROT|nr:GNAT family N-acetyltransferase [Nisaea acidiphila]UUX50789.1 GNAT family N-acetyltransferase [Nisaea acidiphila]
MKEQIRYLRRAGKDDARALAQLINLAGEGLPLHIWQGMAEEGESVWDVGQRRARREEGSFSYRNATIAMSGKDIAGALVGYPIGGAPEAIDRDTPALFVPLIELENAALNTWYVNVLATYDGFQRRGFATALLEEAARQARAAGFRRMSIIVTDLNERAIRLYRKQGFRETEHRLIAKDGWETDSKHYLLLIKDL